MMAYTYREPLGEFRWLAARGLRIHVKILSAKLFFSGQANSLSSKHAWEIAYVLPDMGSWTMICAASDVYARCRRHWPDHPLEFPRPHDGVENCPSTCHGQHHCHEGCRADTPQRSPCWRAGNRGGSSCWRLEPCSWRWPCGRSCSVQEQAHPEGESKHLYVLKAAAAWLMSARIDVC